MFRSSFPVILTSSSVKVLGKSVKGFLSYKQKTEIIILSIKIIIKCLEVDTTLKNR